MESTVKADQNRKIIRRKYLNDNALLEIIQKIENNMDQFRIVLRYVKEQTIKEVYLTDLTLNEYLEELSERVEINEDNSAIAIFRKIKDGYQLDKVYDVLEYSFVPSDFLDVAYSLKFKESTSKLNQYLMKPNF